MEALFERTEIKHQGNTLCVSPVTNSSGIWDWQRVLLHQADHGWCGSHGIGLDEFTKAGHFNCKFFWNANLLTVENPQGEVLCTAVIGPSKLSRSRESCGLCHVYIFGGSKQSSTEESLSTAQALLSACLSHAKKAGYKGVITDVYQTDTFSMALYSTAGFIVHGTLPYVGVIKNQGHTHSIMYYKEL